MNCKSLRIKGYKSIKQIRFIGFVLFMAALSTSLPIKATERTTNPVDWLFEGKLFVLSQNYENDLIFVGAQLSREGVRHGFGFELSGNFAKVDDRGDQSYEHVQVVSGVFIKSLIWSNSTASFFGELATGLAFSSQQQVDGDDFGLVEPAASFYVEPRIHIRATKEYWQLRPSFGIGYLTYTYSDVEFSAFRIHLGFAF